MANLGTMTILAQAKATMRCSLIGKRATVAGGSVAPDESAGGCMADHTVDAQLGNNSEACTSHVRWGLVGKCARGLEKALQQTKQQLQ